MPFADARARRATDGVLSQGCGRETFHPLGRSRRQASAWVSRPPVYRLPCLFLIVGTTSRPSTPSSAP
jgi:hypothetical protein